MIFAKRWERYIGKEFLQFVFFFLLGSYFLYVIVDYSIHVQDFFGVHKISLIKLLQYYLFQFIKRLDTLLPLSLLLGTVKVLCRQNAQFELLAFQSAGLSKKKLVRPLYFIGIFSCIVVFMTNELALPGAVNFIDKIYDTHLRHSLKSTKKEPFHSIQLNDGSQIIYQYYDTAKESFFDVIWVKSPSDLWKIKYLKADPQYTQGEWVDHLVRDGEGLFQKVESFTTYALHDLKWGAEMPRRGFIPLENYSIRELSNLLDPQNRLSPFKRQEAFTQLLLKVAFPFLSPLGIGCIAPFCLQYRRRIPYYSLYSFSLFGFVGFITLLDATAILGEGGVISPLLAILSPLILLTALAGWSRLRTL